MAHQRAQRFPKVSDLIQYPCIDTNLSIQNLIDKKILIKINKIMLDKRTDLWYNRLGTLLTTLVR